MIPCSIKSGFKGLRYSQWKFKILDVSFGATSYYNINAATKENNSVVLALGVNLSAAWNSILLNKIQVLLLILFAISVN